MNSVYENDKHACLQIFLKSILYIPKAMVLTELQIHT